MAVVFDTLKLADRLEAAGMPPEQARGAAAALAEAMTATVATAADIAAVRGEIRESELRLRGDIAAVRGEIAAVRTETHEIEARLRAEITGVHTEIATVRTEIAGLRGELIKWAVGIGIAGVLAIGGMILSATLALVRLLH